MFLYCLTHSLTHIQTHTPYTHSVICTLSRTYTYTYTLSHTCSLSYTLSHTTHTNIHSFKHPLSLSDSHSLYLTLLTHTHTYIYIYVSTHRFHSEILMGSPGQFGGRVYANSCDNLCAGLKEDNYSFQLSPRTPRVQPCSDWGRREEGEMRRHSSNDIPPVSECRWSSAPATLPVQVPRTFSSRLASSFSYTKGVIITDPTPTPITPQTPRRTFFSHYPSSSLLYGHGSVRPPSAILEASCEGSDAFPTSECIHAGCFSVSADLLAAANMTPIVEGAGMISNTASSATASSPKERSHGRNPDPGGSGEPGRIFSTDPGPSHPRDTENAFKSPYGVGVEATKTSSSIMSREWLSDIFLIVTFRLLFSRQFTIFKFC